MHHSDECLGELWFSDKVWMRGMCGRDSSIDDTGLELDRLNDVDKMDTDVNAVGMSYLL
jgi:hypothetical protein